MQLKTTTQRTILRHIICEMPACALLNDSFYLKACANDTVCCDDKVGNIKTTTETWPTTKFTQSFYDGNNNLTQAIDNKGQITKNRYDAANRLDQKTYFINASATAPIKTVTFSYNNANTLTGYSDGITSATYLVDDLQRKTNETVNFGTFSKTLATSYYKNSLKKTFTDAENIINSYNYDAGNRLSQISLPAEGSIIFNQYQWNSPAKITYPGGLTRTISYDPLMRTNSINNSDSAKNTLMNYAYAYDKVGNIKSKNTEHGNYVYGYDERYRLTTVDNPVVAAVSSLVDEGFTYDDAGNRLTDSSTTGNWVYNSTNQLTSNSELAIDYDANGSTIKKTKAGVITTFDYNTENRLSTVKDNVGATVATYYYDPFGRRLSKDVSGTRTYFMYAAEGLIAEIDATGTVTQSYSYQPQSTYGTSPLTTKTAAGYAYYQLDHLGTPQQLVNKMGLVVWKAKALAFGDTTVEVNVVANNLRFPGQYFDEETGTFYNYFRDYDASTGRYVQSDPIGLGGGLNAFGYVGGNPLNNVDLFGLCGANETLIESGVYKGDPYEICERNATPTAKEKIYCPSGTCASGTPMVNLIPQHVKNNADGECVAVCIISNLTIGSFRDNIIANNTKRLGEFASKKIIIKSDGTGKVRNKILVKIGKDLKAIGKKIPIVTNAMTIINLRSTELKCYLECQKNKACK